MDFVKNISSELSDLELVNLIKSGSSRDVSGLLFQRYIDMLYGVCLKYTGNSAEAKDCVMEIYEQLTEKLKKYEVNNFRGWIYQLAKNYCLMKMRQQKKPHIDISTVQLVENMHPDEDIMTEQNFKLVEECMKMLREEQKQMIRLFYVEGKCYKEISEKINLDINMVRSHIQNGRRNLKICVERKSL